MRRPLALLLAAVATAAVTSTGCGGGSSSASGLDEALGFLPKDAPFAVAISTDTNSDQYKSADAIVRKFPYGDQAVASLKKLVERGGLSYDNDVKPILGNPFVVGAPTPEALQGGNSSNEYVAALQAKDSGKLEDLVKKDSKEVGDKNGFTIYEDKSGDRLARKDDVVVFAGSSKLLDDALAQRDGGDRLTEADFDKGLAGLPKDAVVRVYGDAERLLKADSGSAQARRVKWVDALRKFGATASIKRDAIDVEFNLHTDPAQLSDEDLPLASGDQAPGVVEQPGEISFSLRDLAHIEKFGEAAGQAISPSGFGQFEQGKRQIERQLGISIDKDVLGQLTGDLAGVTTIDGKFGVRAELKDPTAFRATLKKMAPSLPRLAKSIGFGTVGLAKPKRGEDFYALAQPDGDSVVFGVVKDALVVANEAGRAGKLSTATPTSVPGARGSLVGSADAEKLANAIIGQLGNQLGAGVSVLGQRFTGPLGRLSGSVKSSTSGLTGKITLTID